MQQFLKSKSNKLIDFHFLALQTGPNTAYSGLAAKNICTAPSTVFSTQHTGKEGSFL
jgi:hypothetical protein